MSEMLDVDDDVDELLSAPVICCSAISSDMISWLNELPLEPEDDLSSDRDDGGGGGGASVWVVNADEPADAEEVAEDEDVADDELLESDCIDLSNEKMSDDPTLPTDMTFS